MRHPFAAVVLTLALAGCAARPAPQSCPLPPKPVAAAPVPESLADRKSACEALYNHLADLATDVYIEAKGLKPGSSEAKLVKPMIDESLRARGVKYRFALSCMLEMDRDTIRCELAGKDFEAVQACEPDETTAPAPLKPKPVVSDVQL